ncbi:MAG: pyrophosphatase [Burkholderiales bacterium]
MKPFKDRIHGMNAMYRLPIHSAPTLPANLVDRLTKFKKTLTDEINEIDEIIAVHKASVPSVPAQAFSLTMIADLLGDIIVYCRSEAMKFGIPLEDVLDIIMDSNESKLGEDGQPIYDENQKFLKGPNYWKPEPKIRELLLSRGIVQGDWF